MALYNVSMCKRYAVLDTDDWSIDILSEEEFKKAVNIVKIQNLPSDWECKVRDNTVIMYCIDLVADCWFIQYKVIVAGRGVVAENKKKNGERFDYEPWVEMSSNRVYITDDDECITIELPYGDTYRSK